MHKNKQKFSNLIQVVFVKTIKIQLFIIFGGVWFFHGFALIIWRYRHTEIVFITLNRYLTLLYYTCKHFALFQNPMFGSCFYFIL